MTLLLLGCKGVGNEWQKAPVTHVKPGSTVHLRVVHATNPRLPKMSQDQLRIMLASAKQTVKQNFGVDVEFTDIPEIGIDRLFALIPPPVREVSISYVYDFEYGDPLSIAKNINSTLTKRGTTLADGLAFAAPYLPATAHPKDLNEFSELLSNAMVERWNGLRSINAPDGEHVIDNSTYNEWFFWNTLGYGNLQYDLVITNQLIASAATNSIDIHSAIRGGLAVGTTTYNRHGKYGQYVFWTTFPFTDSSDITKLMRGGEEYSDVEAAQLSGAYLAHEIGHLLFQFGHPFGQKACVMNPVSMLRFREWFNQINSAGCPIDSRPEMSAGAVSLDFNSSWLKMSREPYWLWYGTSD
jgi:hypothetical protein